MYHEGMCRESMYCARTKSFSWRPDNESLCFEHDAPYAGISLREQLFITNIVLMPLQNRKGCCPSADHPTRFCQAPNRFDKDAVKDIMFGRDDTKKDSKRRDSRLIVIGDDRQTPLHRVPQLRCDRYPLLQIGRAGSRGTRRVASEPYKDSSRRLTASTGMSPWFLCFAI